MTTNGIGRSGEDLLPLLELESLGNDRFRSLRNDANVRGDVFGGQYLGQAITAAIATGDRRAPNAMTGYFLRAAHADRPLELQVQRMRDGRNFAHRRVTIMQSDQLMFVADVSLHDPEPEQVEHQCKAPSVPPPESLIPLNDVINQHREQFDPKFIARVTNRKYIEMVPVDAQAGFTGPGIKPAIDFWLRAVRLCSHDPLMHYAGLAYLSDCWVSVSARIMHVPHLFESQRASASLNHGIWFHRAPLVTDWLLYTLEGPTTGGGTGFNRGMLFDREGRLLASTVQEALMRRAHAE